MPKPKKANTIKELEEKLDNDTLGFTELPTFEDLVLQTKAGIKILGNAKDLSLKFKSDKELAENIFVEAADWFISLYEDVLPEEDNSIFLELMASLSLKRVKTWKRAIRDNSNDKDDPRNQALKITLITALFGETLEAWEEYKRRLTKESEKEGKK